MSDAAKGLYHYERSGDEWLVADENGDPVHIYRHEWNARDRVRYHNLSLIRGRDGWNYMLTGEPL